MLCTSLHFITRRVYRDTLITEFSGDELHKYLKFILLVKKITVRIAWWLNDITRPK